MTHETYDPKYTGLLSESAYKELYTLSLRDPEAFWDKEAQRLDWYKKWTEVKSTSFNNPISIKWYLNGKLNVSYNCIDRHLKTQANKIAYVWEPENPSEACQKITYQHLHDKVCQWSHLLKNYGVKKGDRVTIYMPMIPEAVYSMLACARIGAVHSVVFGGFSPDSLAGRINDCESNYVITADQGYRGGKAIDLKKNVDQAIKTCPHVKQVFVVQRTKAEVEWNKKLDVWVHDVIHQYPTQFEPEVMDSEDPLFILYTSGSTNKPKGVLHTTGGYLVYASMTHQYIFNYMPQDIYWCAADIGWVTGHSYIVYGPLCNAASSIIYEGLPTFPTSARLWEIVDRYKVNTLYTAPTLLRALMRDGDQFLNTTQRDSLKLLGSVGEPINPEAWLWYYNKVGHGRCPIVDTWWQTETGGICISPQPGTFPLKPGSATKPFFGICAQLVDAQGKVLEGEAEGNLCITDSWPGQMRTVYKDHERFYQTYFSQFPGKYFTGDGCKRDRDGYYWITGRVDDVINVSGHRIGTAEIESALVGHTSVAEAAVVGFPHDIKGQGIYAYVTLKNNVTSSDELKKELSGFVRKQIGGLAVPDFIQWAPGLPKTRSGKIMRRILRKISQNDYKDLGDTSTLADPNVVNHLIDNRLNK